MKKWEYMVTEYPQANCEVTEQFLDEHGMKGWELVQILGAFMVFKRPMQ